MTHHIQVAVRIRPAVHADVSNIHIRKKDETTTSLTFQEDGSSHSFDFNSVFPSTTTQDEIHQRIGLQYVDHLIQGFNTTIFAYGQTGSGKTFTMYGNESEIWGQDNKLSSTSGLVPRIVTSLFERIAPPPSKSSISSKPTPSKSPEPSKDTTQIHEEIYYTIKCTFVEVYNNTIRDLLSVKRDHTHNVRETPLKGVWIDGVKEEFVASVQEVSEIVRLGLRRRAVKATKMNDYSSRSHCVFTLTLEQAGFSDGTTKSSCLNLVDLAGSERVRRSGVESSELKEACNINQSLSCLGSCIHALTQKGRTHIPYRDSKLTHMLKESLGGNSRTCLLTTISPEPMDAQETLNSIRFGSIAQSVKIHPRVNVRKSNVQLVAELETMRKIVFTLEKENDALREVVSSSNTHKTSEDISLSNKLKTKCEVLESAVASLMSKLGIVSSELKIARKAKLSIEKDLDTFQAMTKNSRVEAVKELSSAWTRLREKDKELLEKERELLGKEKELSEREDRLELERVDLSSEWKCFRERNAAISTSGAKSKEIMERADESTTTHEFIRSPTTSGTKTSIIDTKTSTNLATSKDFSSSSLMMASFEKLWEQANQDADLAMLASTECVSSSSHRPQSAFVRVRCSML